MVRTFCKNGRRKTLEKYTKQKKTEKGEKKVDGRSEKGIRSKRRK